MIYAFAVVVAVLLFLVIKVLSLVIKEKWGPRLQARHYVAQEVKRKKENAVMQKRRANYELWLEHYRKEKKESD